MVSTPERKPAHVTVEECREQAHNCLQAANKAHAEPRAAWLKLAEQWLEMANRIHRDLGPRASLTTSWTLARI